MTRRVAAILTLGVLAILAGSPASAHEGHNHTVMGTVTMAAADHIMVKDKDGKEVTVQVTKDTKVKSKPPIKVDEIKAGTRVVITAREDKDKSLKARTIEVGPPPAAAPSSR